MGLENPLHLAFIALVIVMVFGAKRLPEIGRSAGKGLREFKSVMSLDTEPSKPAPAPAPAIAETASPAIAVTPVATDAAADSQT
jgi:sec-independent protein translocase protein TatA